LPQVTQNPNSFNDERNRQVDSERSSRGTGSSCAGIRLLTIAPGAVCCARIARSLSAQYTSHRIMLI
jgi:hypothetical protein